MAPFRPTSEQIAAAFGRKIHEVIGPNLLVLFCGINPGLYSGAVGHHFARPGNRFWPALHRGGFTDSVWSPFDDAKLLEIGCGVTNIVNRATGSADQLSTDELVAGARRLVRRIKKFRPAWVAFLGLTAYRIAFERRAAKVGRQAERVGDTRIWVLPNPSGLNAHYQVADFGRLFAELRKAALESANKSC
jgi:TDG/mug DNA glycosylase family protein